MRAAVPLVAGGLALAIAIVATGIARGADDKKGRVSGRLHVFKDGKEKPMSGGAVVWLVGFDEPPPDTIPELRQHNRQFEPNLLAVTAGQKISFPNGDATFHNVFSLSPARKFDLGQFVQGDSKTQVFPKQGVIDVFCNIHPDMAATILVLPNRRFATTGPDGSFTIDGVPPGSWKIYAYDRMAERPVKADVAVTAEKTSEIDMQIEQTRTLDHKNKYGEDYGKRPY